MTDARTTTRRHALARAVKIAFYLIIAAAFAWFLWKVDWRELEDHRIAWWWFAGSIVLALAFRFYAVVVWRVILHALGATTLPRYTVLADIYARAWMGRYIPGKVAWLAAKVYLAAEHGISKSRLAVSTMVEGATQVVGAGAVSLALLAIDGRVAEIAPSARIAVLVGAVLLALLMLPPIFNRAMALGFRLLKRGRPVPLSWSGVASSVGLYAGGSVVSGGAYVLLTFALIPGLDGRDAVYLVGAFGFAGVLGMVAPFVPSGLGVRDGAQLVLLLVLVSQPEAVLVVVASRVWSALTDVLFWAVATGIRVVDRRRSAG